MPTFTANPRDIQIIFVDASAQACTVPVQTFADVTPFLTQAAAGIITITSITAYYVINDVTTSFKLKA